MDEVLALVRRPTVETAEGRPLVTLHTPVPMWLAARVIGAVHDVYPDAVLVEDGHDLQIFVNEEEPS